MIVNVKRKGLLALAKKVARAAPAGDISSTQSRGIFVEVDDRLSILRMTATNFDIAIQASFSASVDMPGCFVIDAGLFVEILNKMPGENLYLELKSNTYLFVKSESTELTVAVLPGDKYPKLDIPYPDETIAVAGLKTLIQRSAFAVVDNKKIKAANPIYNCINLILSSSGIYALAGNNSGIVQVFGDRECSGQISLLIPVSSLKTLASLSLDSDVYEMGITGAGTQGKNVVFFDGTMIFSARLIDGKFMNVSSVFNSYTAVATASIAAEKLQAAFYHATTALPPGGTVELSLKDNSLLFCCKTDAGHSSVTVEAKVSNPSSVARHYLAQYLLNCIRTLNGEVVLSMSADGVLLIQNGDMTYLQSYVYINKKNEQQREEKTAA